MRHCLGPWRQKAGAKLVSVSLHSFPAGVLPGGPGSPRPTKQNSAFRWNHVKVTRPAAEKWRGVRGIKAVLDMALSLQTGAASPGASESCIQTAVVNSPLLSGGMRTWPLSAATGTRALGDGVRYVAFSGSKDGLGGIADRTVALRNALAAAATFLRPVALPKRYSC